MRSGENNVLASAVGFCAQDVEEGFGCEEGADTIATGSQAAEDLTKVLQTALRYHEEGWLRALVVFARNYGGWSLQLEGGGQLTKQGEALVAFAEEHSAPTPKVTSVSPDNGPAAGGTRVTITGSGFTKTTAVEFGDAKAADIEVESPASLTATSPAGSGTVDVTASNSSGSSAATAGDLFAYDPVRSGPWLGAVSNSSLSWLGGSGAEVFSAYGVVFDRGGWNRTESGQGIEFEAGEAPKADDDLERAFDAGMVPVVAIDYEGSLEHGWGPDEKFPHTPAQIEAYVKGFVATARSIREAYPGREVLFELMHRPEGNTTPEYDAEEYADVVAQVLPAARAAGIPLDDVYVTAIAAGKNAKEEWESWIPEMYRADPSLEGEVRGWATEPGGTPPGSEKSGMEALLALRKEMRSGENDVIVSRIGLCAEDVEEGFGCEQDTETVSTGSQAAEEMTKTLEVALEYHQEGWLRAMLVFSRGYGGWSLQLEDGDLTKEGEALIAFAEAHSAPIPRVGSVTPDSGSVEGGTSVTITGAGFLKGTTVEFGGKPATSVDVESTKQITATSPAGTGTVDVTVSTTGGSSAHRAGDRFQYTGEAPVNMAAPTILGTVAEGQTLIAEPGSWSGPGPIGYAYQWQDCNPKGRECEDVEGATGDTYTLSGADLEATVRVLVTAANSQGSTSAVSAASAEVAPGAPSEIEAPTVGGVARAGETLWADAGRWGGETEVGYQWERCNEEGEECVEVRGATSGKYPLGEGDVGSTLRVRVGVSSELGAATAISAASSPVLPASLTLEATSGPTLTGTPVEGETLVVLPGGWSGVQPISYAYQWQRCDADGARCEDIEAQQGTSYDLSEEDVGSVVAAVVTATDPDGSVSDAVATARPVGAAAAPLAEEAPLIAGPPVEGQTLRASAGAWSAGAEALSYSYAWERCDETGRACAPIEGAAEATYTPSKADVQRTLRVVVTASDGKGSASDTSAASATVGPAAPANVAVPSVAGAGELGEPLEADPGIWIGEGAIVYSYQWQRCNAGGEECASIEGATGASYKPVAADLAKALRVAVTATGPAGKAGATSAPTAPVAAEPRAPKNTSAPELEGYPTAGETLAVQVGSWSGSEPIAYSYQWQRCNEEGAGCTNIEGATTGAYNLTEGDVGSTLRAIVRASNSVESAEAASAASEAISLPGPPQAGGEEPSIHGDTQVGQKVFAEDGGWSGSRPLRFHYQWRLCDAAGEGCKAIEGATGSSYTIAGDAADMTLRVAVTASNGLGSAVALSAAVAVAPEGQASTTPAIAAVEEQDPSILTPAEAAELEGEEIKPEIANAEEAIAAGGELTSSTISTETTGELAVNTAVGEIGLRQLGVPLNATSTPTIVNNAVAAYAGTAAETDTFVRPAPLGETTLLQLLSAGAPTTYTWELSLGIDQQLEKLPDGDAAVVEPLESPSFEAELPSEPFGEAESETVEEPEGEGEQERAAEEELDRELEEEGLLEALPEAPETTTPELVAKAGELHPQDTYTEYAKAVNAMQAAQEQTEDATIMVIQAPHVLDASGVEVPASLAVEGDAVTLTIAPTETTAYPATAEVAVSAPPDAVSGAVAHRARYGLSDERASAFDESEEEGRVVDEFDRRLKTGPLKVGIARKIVAWNAWSKTATGGWVKPAEHSQLVEWLEAVKTAHLKAYITLRACYTQGSGCRTPSPPEYYEGVREMMRALVNGDGDPKFPAVRIWGTFNEPHGKPSDKAAKGPKRELGEPELLAWEAARMWGETERAAAAAQCLHFCVVVAGEFEKYANQSTYIHQYVAYIKRAERRHEFPTGVKPDVWGMHDYNDLTNVRAERAGGEDVLGGYRNTEAEGFVRTIRSRRLYPGAAVWMSEEGVLLQPQKEPHTRIYRHPELERLAAEDFLRLGEMKHVELADYYGYRAPADISESEEYDSALLSYHKGYEGSGPEAKEPQDWRQAYCVLALGRDGCPPEASTRSAVAGATGSTVGEPALLVDPNGLPTNYWVEYGTTSAYGQSTAQIATASATGVQSERVMLRKLQPCTTYHYRADAENAAGAGGGEDETLTTSCAGTAAVTAIAAGWEHTCELISSGEVECWGDNEDGQLGDGTTEASATPVRVTGITDAVAITAGLNYSCALLEGGGVECWGGDRKGQLGDGGGSNHTTPVAVAGVTEATSVTAAGEVHACAVLVGGGLECWGADEADQAPALVEGLAGPAVRAGGGVDFTCALLASGGVQCWGKNPVGLGDGTTTESATPVTVAGITTATSLSAGGYASVCASLISGHVECWGENYFGELGDGTTIASSTPVRVEGIDDAAAVSAGESSVCAVLDDGGVKCWGNNEFEQLGNGTKTNSSTPVSVKGITDATSVSASGLHACALLADDSVRCWGYIEPAEEEGGGGSPD